MQRNSTLENFLNVPELVTVTILPADIKHTEELDFDDTDVSFIGQ